VAPTERRTVGVEVHLRHNPKEKNMAKDGSDDTDTLKHEGSAPTAEDSDTKQEGGEPKTGDIDLKRLRLPQNFGATLGVKKLLLIVKVGKPHPQHWIRTHPDPSWQLQTMVIELKDENEVYLVAPELWNDLANEVKPRLIVAAINRQGAPFLWPLRLPEEDGRKDDWASSALQGAEAGKTGWIRIKSNMACGYYEVTRATITDAPVWPEVGFDGLMKIAFKDRFITSLDHPVVRQLRGEV
jgi:hypothetical protein